ncbi:MAG: alpha-1,2-fucosyltransferase, partial [Candidatus Marsarchaeota archaeon]|nr:alpha-1,2-fucosyltransferase [Candidatus Marsarchaeota archaeon]
QYAAGRRLGIQHETSLKLDLSYFDNSKHREYSLKPFCIQEEFASLEEIAEITGSNRKRVSRLAFRASQRLKPYYGRSVFSESEVNPFDPNILRAPRHLYLDGYWQSEKFFIGIQDMIRREFTVKYEQDRQSQEVAKRIKSTVSVSVHVRRGDFVSNPQTRRVHGGCSLECYQECARRISEKVPDPHFFIFSNEPQWVAENLSLGYPTTVVRHNDPSKGYEDLRLMSTCQHHIIANSSFSWWAAWLGSYPEKLVFALSTWFADSRFDTRDVLPKDWICIRNS